MPYLALTPDELPTAKGLRIPFAHVAYAIGEGGHLVARELPVALRGGIMVLSDHCPTSLGHTNALCRSLLNECSVRHYNGILADFETAPREDRLNFLTQLASLLARNGQRLYVPENYAVDCACILICTAVSGGTLRERLCEAKRCYGCVALDCTRLMMDFPLPCRSGTGNPLKPEEFAALSARYGSPCFFSDELGANYFTYYERGSGHFVLFDTAQTLRHKLRLGHEIGYETAFFMLPEVKDILPQLFSNQ